MTIAIAAKWPWERVLELSSRRNNAAFPQAAILLSDSRWTISRPSDRDDSEIHLDIGTKLFQLSNDAGAVYAGDVASGEECLWRLARRFHQRRVDIPPQELAHGLFRQIYANHQTDSPLRIWIGVCSPSSIAELWLFSSDHGFEPIESSGVQILAFPETEKVFREGLEVIVLDSFENPSNIPIGPDLVPDTSKRIVPLTPDRGANWLAIALKGYVLMPDVDQTVGGKIQCAIIDRGGFRTISFTMSPLPNLETWEDLSPAPGELITVNPRAGQGRRAFAEAALSFHQAVE